MSTSSIPTLPRPHTFAHSPSNSLSNSASFQRSQSPTKPDLKPNPHPYAIKTTSTGALSRSNSSPHNPQGGKKSSYIPESPSKAAAGYALTAGTTRSLGHRYSKSLNKEPPPIPFPAAISVSLRRNTAEGTNLKDLPENPKLWTPAQLSVYLGSGALRVTAGSLPIPVVKDIAEFAKRAGISGKRFLRFNKDDLADLEISQVWRSALLAASRDLRQNVLRGRIWQSAFEDDDEHIFENKNPLPTTFPSFSILDEQPASTEEGADETENNTNNNFSGQIPNLTLRELSTGSFSPRKRAISHLSPFAADTNLDTDQQPEWGRNGGMYAVASLSTTDLLHSRSVGEGGGGYFDNGGRREAHPRTVGIIPDRKGRVKGMAAAFERSASESEDDSSDGGSDFGSYSYSGGRRGRDRTESVGSNRSYGSARSFGSGDRVGEEERAVKEAEGEEELSIEALLETVASPTSMGGDPSNQGSWADESRARRRYGLDLPSGTLNSNYSYSDIGIETVKSASGRPGRESRSGGRAEAWEMLDEGGLVTVKRSNVAEGSGRVKIKGKAINGGSVRRALGEVFGAEGEANLVGSPNASPSSSRGSVWATADENAADDTGRGAGEEEDGPGVGDKTIMIREREEIKESVRVHISVGAQTDDIVEDETETVLSRNSHQNPTNLAPPPFLEDSKALNAVEEAERSLRSDISETRGLVEIFRQRLEVVEASLQVLQVEVEVGNLEERIAKAEEEEKQEREREEEREREKWVAEERRTELEKRVMELEGREKERRERANRSFTGLLTSGGFFSKVVGMVYPAANATSLVAEEGEEEGLPLTTPRSKPRMGREVSKMGNRKWEGVVEGKEGEGKELIPTTIGGLPPYLLLVSIGVCAVVLRVVIRKMAGRRT